MCGFTPLLIGSTLLSAAGSVMQGNNAAAMGQAQQQAYNQQADNTRAASAYEATREFERGQRAISQATVAIGGSGVVGGSSTQMALRDITEQNEMDVQTILYNSQMKEGQLRTQGSIAAAQGERAQRAGYLGAAGNVVNGLTTYYNPARSVRVGGNMFA